LWREAGPARQDKDFQTFGGQNNNIERMNIYSFIKEGRDWYIDLPEYLETGGNKGDLQMVEDADQMLDFISGGKCSLLNH
jgi:hypothetical protein